MSPYEIVGLALLAVIATAAFALLRSRVRADLTKTIAAIDYGRDDGQADVQPGRSPHDPHIAYPTEARSFGKRPVGKHPALGMSYGDKEFKLQHKPTFTLTARQIERINTQRKLRGKPPFNRKGLTNAIAHPWDRYDVRQPQTSTDWISYLIAYEILFADHQSSTISGCQGVNIDPNLPYNGHGGEYGGAGASGDWSNGITRSEAQAIDSGDPILPPSGVVTGVSISPDRGPDPSPSYSAPDPSPSYSAPDPSPSYSAPDPSPSYSAPDTSSSPSFDSSPSPVDTSSSF